MSKSPTTVSNHRIPYLDIAKGFAIIFVIIGHCRYSPTILIGWIYSFHMPLFYILSGFTFNIDHYKDFKSFLIKKLKTLMIPYYLLCIMLLILTTLFFSENDISTFTEGLKAIFIANRLHKYYYSMWFIPSLFFSEILLYFIIKGIKNKYALGLLSVLFTAIGYFTFKYIKGFYYSIDTVPIALSFLIFGYITKSFISKSNRSFRSFIIMIVSFFVNIVSCFGNIYLHNGYSIGIYFGIILNPVLFYIAAVSGSIFIIYISLFIKKSFILEYAGKNSLIFYAFQNAFAIPLCYMLIEKISANLTWLSNSYVALLFSMIVSYIILGLLSEFIRRLMPFVIGKPYNKHLFKKNK